MQVLCGREVRFWKLLRPCMLEEESATTCMQLRTNYLQGSARTSLLVERVPACSAAIRRTELFTSLLQAPPDAFDHADLLQSLPGCFKQYTQLAQRVLASAATRTIQNDKVFLLLLSMTVAIEAYTRHTCVSVNDARCVWATTTSYSALCACGVSHLFECSELVGQAEDRVAASKPIGHNACKFALYTLLIASRRSALATVPVTLSQCYNYPTAAKRIRILTSHTNQGRCWRFSCYCYYYSNHSMFTVLVTVL
eukprot:7484-Heterococcus_DN1.PRE.2